MKVKYLAAVAAASVLGLTTLTSCGPETEVEEPEVIEEVDPDAVEEPIEEPVTEPEGE